MRTWKRFFLTAIPVVMLTVTGCGKNAEEKSGEERPVSVEWEENTDETEKTVKEENEAESEGNKQAEDEFLFRFVVRDAYEISIEGTVVTGFVYSGTMRSGDKALLLKEDGTIYDVTVKQIEIYDEQAETTVFADEVVFTEETGEVMPAGVLLEGVEYDQIDNADVLLGIEE